MRHRILVCLSLVPFVLAGLAGPGMAQVVGNPGDATILVYPMGIAPFDADNVQQALDWVASPGTVVLKSSDMLGNPLAFDFGGTAPGNGGVIKLLRPDIVLTGDGWDDTLDEPKTKIINGGGRFTFSPTVAGGQMVFAVRAPGVTIRKIKLNTTFAATGIFIVSTTEFPASDHPVAVERCHITVVNYPVLAGYSAAFPVRVNGNVLRGKGGVSGQWIGFTLRPIDSLPYDEPVVPEDASGNPTRFPFEIINNTIVKTDTSTNISIDVYGWINWYNYLAIPANPDPELGSRRVRPAGTTLPYTNQFVQGDNGPVLIAGNSIRASAAPGASLFLVYLGGIYHGLNNCVVWRNTITGVNYTSIRRGSYGRDIVILDNDLSGAQSIYPFTIEGADTLVSGNVLGPIIFTPGVMPEGVPQPGLILISANYNPAYTPMPYPTERCVIMDNDYRLTGAESGAVLIASRSELRADKGGVGTEVKNNLIFETGKFMPGSGGPGNQITVLDSMVNPATGLPYVYDNRIVGLPAVGLDDPGIGQQVREVNRIRRMLQRGLWPFN
jgi:hypothetical protein